MKKNHFSLKNLSLETYSQWREIKNERFFKKSFFILTYISLIFIIIDVFLRIMINIDTNLFYRWFIDTDRGYPEFFCYTQFIITCACFLFCYFRSKSPLFLSLFIIALIIFLDDSLKIHEKFGGYITDDWNEGITLLRSQDLGEIITWGIIGLFLSGSLVIGLAISELEQRATGILFLAMLMLLAFFAVVVDVLHIIFEKMNIGYKIGYLFTIIEDGGEMIVISLICSTALTTLTKLNLR